MQDLNALDLPELFAAMCPPEELDRLLETLLNEDLRGVGDVTTESIIEQDQQVDGAIVARQEGVVAGLHAADRLLAVAEVAEDVRVQWLVRDGERIRPGRILGRLIGSLGIALILERPLLNLLGHLGGVATLTRRYVDAVTGLPGRSPAICDTRKTTPGLRGLEKYAVACGGGHLHRLGLYDAALFKDNHLAHLAPDRLVEALSLAARTLRAHHELRFVEVEVDSIDQLRQVLSLEAGLVDIVLLDNFGLDDLARAVALRDELQATLLLEASGGVTLDTVRSVAATGVDRIAVGALTHSAPALDVGLDL